MRVGSKVKALDVGVVGPGREGRLKRFGLYEVVDFADHPYEGWPILDVDGDDRFGWLPERFVVVSNPPVHRHSAEAVVGWLDSLPEGTEVVGRDVFGDQRWVKDHGKWSRGQGYVKSITLVAFTLRWSVI